MGLSPIMSVLWACLLFSAGYRAHGADPTSLVFTLGKKEVARNCAPLKAQDGNSLNVVHRYGPCSPGNISEPSLADTLARDTARVASLQAKLSGLNENQTIVSQSGLTVPARYGGYLGTEFVATFGLGTPLRAQTVIIDTGSDVCWVQCQPCVSCYSQAEPLFNPALSSSYSRFSCASATCLRQSPRGCSAGSCLYGVRYGDGSSTIGYLSSERLALTTTSVFPGFAFGCGFDNRGLFKGAAGLFGLGRGTFSVVTQTAFRLGNVFSYCFPSQSSAVGRLTFGPTTATGVVYTPMLTFPQAPSFYRIGLIGISVGATRLPIPATVFSAGTIIDSGAVITRLPPAAYASLRQAFRTALARYRLFSLGFLDTCYDFTGATQVLIPVVKLHYIGVDISLGVPGILYNVGTNQYCLAFAGNPSASDFGIIGNVQQKTFEVVHDIATRRIGFAARACP